MGSIRVVCMLVFCCSLARSSRLLPPEPEQNNEPDLVLDAGYPNWVPPKYKRAPQPAQGRFLYYRKTPKVEKYRSAVHELYMRPYNYVSYESGGPSAIQYRYEYQTPSYHPSYPQQDLSTPPQYEPAHPSYLPAPSNDPPYIPEPSNHLEPLHDSNPAPQSFYSPLYSPETQRSYPTYSGFLQGAPTPYRDASTHTHLSHPSSAASSHNTIFYPTSPSTSSPPPTSSPTHSSPPKQAQLDHHAVAVIKGEKVEGTIHFYQLEGPTSPVRIVGNLTGLTPGSHGFHIHQLGDTTDGCKSMGGHFNPNQVVHGSPKDLYRHTGDLGNIKVGLDGVARLDLVDHQISLNGIYSIIGRGVVVHQDEDDLGQGLDDGSKTTGNAGGRIACAVIGRSSESI